MWNFLLLFRSQHVFIKSGVMTEWICIPHNGKLKEYNMIQHTALNNLFPLDIINTFNKNTASNWFQLENPIKVDFMCVCCHKNDQGIKYNNSQHNK